MSPTDSDIFVMIVGVTVVLLILIVFIISILFIYKNRQVRHLSEMKSVEEKFAREILQTELEIKEQTLRNISEEIHDNVGQVLSVAVLQLSAIDAEKPANSKKIEEVTDIIQKALRDLRNLSKTLDADTIAALGLVSIIRFEMEFINRTGFFKTQLTVCGTEIRLSSHRELIVYRIIQESLNNIIKHAKASAITVKVIFADENVTVEIGDDGIGFDIDQLNAPKSNKSGAGIRNMKKRALLINADLKLTSSPNSGTSVAITAYLDDGN
jgi:two-component system NarL family sensor kinase